MSNLSTKTNDKKNKNEIRNKKKLKSMKESQYRSYNQTIQKQRKRLDTSNKESEQ